MSKTARTKPSRPKRSASTAPSAETDDLRTALQAKSGVRRKSDPPLLPETMVLPGKGRESLKGVVIYLNEAAKDQLARLSIDQRRTVQDLGVEAINLLFRRYREKPIG